MAADDDLALRQQVALASSAAISASDLDFAFNLQVAEAIQASLRAHASNNPSAPSSSNAAFAPSSQPAIAVESSDAAYALAVHATDLSHAEEDRREAQAFRAAHAQVAASIRVAAHDAVFARELAAIPEHQWANDGDYFERPLDSRRSPLFRVFFKGMSSKEVVGPRDRDPGVAVLAVAIAETQGKVVLRIEKPVEGFGGGRMALELMALKEGLHAALGLGIRSITIVTDYTALHSHLLGTWRPNQKKVADMIAEVASVQKNFGQCEISLVQRTQVAYVMKLARDLLGSQIAKSIAMNASKEKREACAICLEDTDVSKIHAVEGCAHRFCFACMKQHVKVKLLHGMLPACPQDGCTTNLTVEGSKVFLSLRLSGIMVQRIREGQIPPGQKIYCPYPKCSALMSLSEVMRPMQESSSNQTFANAATLRKCVECRGSFCIACRVPWHHGMTCLDYVRRYPNARPDDAKLKNLAQQQLWRQCVKCKHMIELAEGCYHITCVCGYEFCYTCGKEWKNKRATCSCRLWDERNIIRENMNGVARNIIRQDIEEDEDDDDYFGDEDDLDEYFGHDNQGHGYYHGGGGAHRNDHFYQR